MKLKIIGILANPDLKKFSKVLNYEDKPSEIVLFCDYSEYDFPKGYIYSKIEDKDGETVFVGSIILKDVSQQFLISYDAIPKGHNTICRFEFDSNIPKVISEHLEHISHWFESKSFLFFK